MTREKAIASIKTLCNTCELFPKCVNEKPECFQAIEMAIKALEQEPCEDAVSREALRKAMYHRAFETDGDTMWQSGCWIRYRAVEQVIKESPSVTPEQKTGKWIKQDCGGVEYTAVCSECGYGTFWSDALDFDFCPKCGSYNGGEQDD